MTRPSPFTLKNKFARLCWAFVYTMFFKPSPRFLFRWRALLLRLFGAKLANDVNVYPSAIIWAPWNLECGPGACIAAGVEIYNPGLVVLGRDAIVSQGAYLCGASHRYDRAEFDFVHRPIVIGPGAWVSARCIILLGVELGEGCVIAAGSVVTKSMPSWNLCGGNPCRVIKSYEKPQA